MGAMHAMLQLMYNWFYLHKKFALEHLKQLFEVGMPAKIYYLKASPEVLLQRISRREVLEPHEHRTDLEKFIPAYDQVLAESKVETEVIQADSGKHLDGLFESISRTYFNN